MILFANLVKKIRATMCAHDLHIGREWVPVPAYQNDSVYRSVIKSHCTACGAEMHDHVG